MSQGCRKVKGDKYCHDSAVEVKGQALGGKPESRGREDRRFILMSSSQEETRMGQWNSVPKEQ